MGAEQAYRRSGRTSLKRRPLRGAYDQATVHAILDAAALCQIGYVADGQPLVLPTVFWRDGGRVYWHGSRASRALDAMAGAQVCFTVSCVDGWVLARSALRHSVNYRSVMAFGAAQPVVGEAAKRAALKGMFDRLYPGRWTRIRPPSPAELASVAVLCLDLDEVSAKIRAEPPLDPDEDLTIPVWAGVAPLQVTAGALQPCARGPASEAAPEGLDGWIAGAAAPLR
jgi:nitroimidazol reductase NimA-like FMN-containing flavoprotein (pyridoxamine 5'-phosphate oxidase superfamily)